MANGSKISERTASITYTAKTPLIDHERDTFTLSLQLPDAAGTTLNFPTLQKCETGQTDWKDIPAAGADHDSVDAPAPAFTVTKAVAEDSHDGHGATAATSSDVAQKNDGGPSWATWTGLGAGLAGLILGGLAFMRSTKRRSGTVPAPRFCAESAAYLPAFCARPRFCAGSAAYLPAFCARPYMRRSRGMRGGRRIRREMSGNVQATGFVRRAFVDEWTDRRKSGGMTTSQRTTSNRRQWGTGLALAAVIGMSGSLAACSPGTPEPSPTATGSTSSSPATSSPSPSPSPSASSAASTAEETPSSAASPSSPETTASPAPTDQATPLCPAASLKGSSMTVAAARQVISI
ncbi:DUF1775 domain-containing protein [Arthrobacter alpinus]|nr:DUF1775 domain-containing protein [Arthrobacter alpinus]